jgi:hypothetical protein
LRSVECDLAIGLETEARAPAKIPSQMSETTFGVAATSTSSECYTEQWAMLLRHQLGRVGDAYLVGLGGWWHRSTL